MLLLRRRWHLWTRHHLPPSNHERCSRLGVPLLMCLLSLALSLPCSLESLLNFQTMVSDLTGMTMSNASLLDESTAAAEAMTMCSAVARGKKPRFLVSDKCHPQTIAVCQTRADGLGLKVEVMDEGSFSMDSDVCGILLQYPATDGSVHNYKVGGWVGGWFNGWLGEKGSRLGSLGRTGLERTWYQLNEVEGFIGPQLLHNRGSLLVWLAA